MPIHQGALRVVVINKRSLHMRSALSQHELEMSIGNVNAHLPVSAEPRLERVLNI